MALCEVFYWGPMLFKTRMKPDEVQKLLQICNKDKKRDARKDLAGHIEDEFSVDKLELSKIIEPYIKIFMKSYGQYYGEKCLDLFINSSILELQGNPVSQSTYSVTYSINSTYSISTIVS